MGWVPDHSIKNYVPDDLKKKKKNPFSNKISLRNFDLLEYIKV